MQQHFTTIEDCQDVYVLCTIIAELFSGSPEADAAVEVKRKMNEWAHSNSGDIYWRDENVKHRNSLFCAQLVCKTFGEDELSTEEKEFRCLRLEQRNTAWSSAQMSKRYQ